MVNKEQQKKEKIDPDWIIELAKGLSEKNLIDLSEQQKKKLCEQYLLNLKEGMKPKEAIDKSFQCWESI
jgi:hypothetical protein